MKAWHFFYTSPDNDAAQRQTVIIKMKLLHNDCPLRSQLLVLATKIRWFLLKRESNDKVGFFSGRKQDI